MKTKTFKDIDQKRILKRKKTRKKGNKNITFIPFKLTDWQYDNREF